jgi:hypothetical protein
MITDMRVLSHAILNTLTIAIFSIPLIAQTNLKKNVLFTLAPGESILYNEYFATQILGGNNFSCVTVNKNNKLATFIFNGARIFSIDISKHLSYKEMENWGYSMVRDIFDIVYLNSTEKDGYVITYEKDEDEFINYHGKTFGPYESIWAGDYVRSDFDFIYELANKIYGHKNGKGQIISDGEIYKTKLKQNIFDYKYVNSAYYITKNGSTWNNNGYPSVNELCESANQDYAFWYNKNSKIYLNINGADYTTTFNQICDLKFNVDNKLEYKFSLANNGRVYSYNGEIHSFERFNCTTSGTYGGVEFFRSDRDDQPNEIEFEFETKDKQNSFYSKYNYEYVVVNGERIGSSPALGAWYDEEKKKFVWYSIEGKNLVLYEYFL